MRSLRFGLLALALAMPSVAPAQATTDSVITAHRTAFAPDVGDTLTIQVSPSVSVELPAPSKQPSFPVEYVAIGLAAAVAKRGRKGGVAMFVDSDIHVMRDNKKGDPELKVIKGGQLLEDTDLTDEEVDELTARRVIRPATAKELAQLEKSEANAEREELVKEQEGELTTLRAKHEQALAAAPETKKAAIEEKQSAEVTKLQTAHAKALAKFDEE